MALSVGVCGSVPRSCSDELDARMRSCGAARSGRPERSGHSEDYNRETEIHDEIPWSYEQESLLLLLFQTLRAFRRTIHRKEKRGEMS